MAAADRKTEALALGNAVVAESLARTTPGSALLEITKHMKIATFNINNINKRLANLLAWLRSAQPDVVCLQELKAAEREFPQKAIAEAGYRAVWCGQKSWNGVATSHQPCASSRA